MPRRRGGCRHFFSEWTPLTTDKEWRQCMWCKHAETRAVPAASYETIDKDNAGA